MSHPIKFSRRIPLSAPHMSGPEIDTVREAFAAHSVSTRGAEIAGLERDFRERIGRPAVALSSGTAAIHLGLRVLDVQPGDEVVCPTLTFVATCNPVLYEGAAPVLIDSDSHSWNLDPNLLADFLKVRAAQNRLPRIVVVTHLFGQSAEMHAISQICAQYNIPILEDAAESLGAKCRGHLAGVFGAVSAFSFNVNKIITAGGGGMLAANDLTLCEKARFMSNQSCDPGIGYSHSEIGYNYRFNNLLAALARAQLRLLDERIAQRREIRERYVAAFADLPGLTPMPVPEWSFHTGWLSCFLVNESQSRVPATDLILALDAANIEARPVWKPMHLQKLYRTRECIGGQVAADLSRRGVCLPSSSNLSGEEQAFVIERVRAALLRV